MKNQPPTPFYDLDAIRCAPILDVCGLLGLDVEKKGKNFWCKVRPEKTASVILHPDRNCFYDFGNQEKGGVIQLVQYASGRSYKESLKFLADAFGIKPTQSMQDIISRPLTQWEYSRIGIQGDLATKNLTFPIETATPEELADLSYAFRMSMNELRKQCPDVYEGILKDKAIPFVEDLRNNYYRQVWNHYDFLRTFGHGADFFDSQRTAAKFEARTVELERAERILDKAAFKTNLRVPAPQRYDPQRVLSHIMQGKPSFDLGTVSEQDLAYAAKQAGCEVCAAQVSYDDYFRLKLQDIAHSASFSADKVTLRYLPQDRQAIETRLPKLPLASRIAEADQRRRSQHQPTDRTNKKENAIF